MGYEAIYKCKKCGNSFTAFSGGGEYFDEYRCVNCDEITQVEKKCFSDKKDVNADQTKDEVGKCYLCGGELSKDILPMCKKCKSRDVQEVIVVSRYD